MSDYIIYGYCPTGEAALRECLNRNWNVVCYCDDREIKRDHYEAGVPILSLKEIRKSNIKGTFIIAIANCGQIINKLDNSEEYILAAEILDGPRPDINYATKKKDMANIEVDAFIAEQNAYLHPERLFLRNVDLEITERCSMRCRDCSNLMQYYEHPKNFAPADLIHWMTVFSSYFDEIFEVRLIGGEPFMHTQVQEILSELIKLENIRQITFYTNATIVPKDSLLDVMTSPKVGACITDYGDLSRNIHKMIQAFDERHIIYDVHEAGMWAKCSDIRKRNRASEDIEQTFINCCAKNLYTILDGKFFRCPFMANAMNLQAMPYIEDDYIDICSLGDDREKARLILKDFLKRSYWASCDYCSGRLFDGEEIPAAIQIAAPLPYEKV